MSDIPIITIDGPSGAGKGTIAAQVAAHLGWHLLDSGALYRVTAYAVEQAGVDCTDEARVAQIAGQLQVRFTEDAVIWQDTDISLAIRTETIANQASKVAVMPAVRLALLDWQRQQARMPGLVADGRDMGTVVFPQAMLKVFLTASAKERAQRRYKQLEKNGITANISDLIATIQERDVRDRNRRDAPLVPAEDAILIDSTDMSISAVLNQVLQAVEQGA